MSILRELFFTFARIGMFTFGGGYAMLSLIRHACIEQKHWMSSEEMMDVTVIAESTPGPVAINCATWVGWKQKGMAGALAATAGIVMPSFCIIYVISLFLDHYAEIAWIAGALTGIRAAAGILIADAALKMIRRMPQKLFPRMILCASFAAMTAADLCGLPVSSLSVMAAAALISLAVCFMNQEDAA